jgi:hypothetical protein
MPMRRPSSRERRDREPAVERLVALAQRLHRAQLPDLGQREIAGEVAFLGEAVDDSGALAAGELRQVLHVGGGDQVRLVARDQVAVLGGDEVGLDVVGAQLDGQRVALERVVGQVARGAAVADDERRVVGAMAAVVVGQRRRGRGEQRGRDADRGAHGLEGMHGGLLVVVDR